jgi:sulfate transport system permease protein
MGWTIGYLLLVVIFPLMGLVSKATLLTWDRFVETMSDPRVIAAFELSFGAATSAALFDVVFGGILAWCLVRYSFSGRRLLDALVDLPFALPTAVAGIALTSIYAENGIIGRLAKPIGVRIAFTPLGVFVALVFIGLPFVVRTLEPVLQDLDKDVEEAAACLGASRWQTFCRVLFPELVPALVAAFVLAFARGVGEYGSVVFISGNMPMKTEIVPLVIVTKLEQYDYAGATAIALVMLCMSLGLMLAINFVERWRRKQGIA